MSDVSRLPGPNADFWDWQLNAACRGMDSDIFYHPEGERGPERDKRISRAKAVCSTCSVIKACQFYSIKSKEPYGVWGGLSEEERFTVIRNVERNLKRKIS